MAIVHKLRKVTAEQMAWLWKGAATRGELGQHAEPKSYWVSVSGHIEIFPWPAPGTIKSIHIEIEGDPRGNVPQEASRR